MISDSGMVLLSILCLKFLTLVMVFFCEEIVFFFLVKKNSLEEEHETVHFLRVVRTDVPGLKVQSAHRTAHLSLSQLTTRAASCKKESVNHYQQRRGKQFQRLGQHLYAYSEGEKKPFWFTEHNFFSNVLTSHAHI